MSSPVPFCSGSSCTCRIAVCLPFGKSRRDSAHQALEILRRNRSAFTRAGSKVLNCRHDITTSAQQYACGRDLPGGILCEEGEVFYTLEPCKMR